MLVKRISASTCVNLKIFDSVFVFVWGPRIFKSLNLMLVLTLKSALFQCFEFQKFYFDRNLCDQHRFTVLFLVKTQEFCWCSRLNFHFKLFQRIFVESQRHHRNTIVLTFLMVSQNIETIEPLSPPGIEISKRNNKHDADAC